MDLSNNVNLSTIYCVSNSNLEYINIKNGNNQAISILTSGFNFLPALNDVCIDDVNSALANFILSQVAHPVTLSETCLPLPVTVGIADVAQQQILAYPNPTKNVLYISGGQVAQIQVYNTVGQQVLASKDSSAISLSQLETGLYLAKITDSYGRTTLKNIVKE